MRTELRTMVTLTVTAVAALTTAHCAPGTPDGVTRTYYIAADPVDWDYAPADRNIAFTRPFKKQYQMVGVRREDLIDLDGAFITVTAEMIPDDPGTWLYHCHVAEHAAAMTVLYRVLPANGVVPADTAGGRTVDPGTGIVTDYAVGS
jgi:Multicopper oxidase